MKVEEEEKNKKKRSEEPSENVRGPSVTCCVNFGSRDPGTRIYPGATLPRDGDDCATYNFTLQRYQERTLLHRPENLKKGDSHQLNV